MLHKYKRTVRDLAALRAHLLASGFPECSVSSLAGDVYIHHPADPKADPTALVKAYVDPDYYEIASSLPSTLHPAGTRNYVMPVTGGRFTVTRRSGRDGSLIADARTAVASWHGHETTVTPSTLSFANGTAEVVVGAVPKASGGGYLFVDNDSGEHAHVFVAVQ